AEAERQTAVEHPAAPLKNNKGNDSCASADGSEPGGKGRRDCGKDQKHHHQASTLDEVVDLGELADRVAEALVGMDEGSVEVVIAHRTAKETATASEISAGIDVGKTCGKGEFRKTCNLGEECCNSSCGTCAPGGQACLQLECGELTRSDSSSKLGNGSGVGGASRRFRFRRLEALMMSLGMENYMPPKDRLQDLRLQQPELFSHVSLKGFKRLISQVIGLGSEMRHNPHAFTTPALRHRSDNVQSSSLGIPEMSAEGIDLLDPQRLAVKINGKTHVPPKGVVSSRVAVQQQQQPRTIRVQENERILHEIRPDSEESLNLIGRVNGQQLHAAVPPTVEGGDTARDPSSPGLKSPGNARAAGVEKTSFVAAEMGAGDDGNRNRLALSSGTYTTCPWRPHVAPGSMVEGRERLEVSAPSALLLDNGYSSVGEGKSVWDIGRPLTGLADIDLPATMNGLLQREISEAMQEESDRLGRERAAAIKAAMSLLWQGYSEHAWGYDEVKPLGRRGNNNWGGMGVTLVDSLDTLWLMGLTKEFYDGRDWVRDHMTFDKAGMVSVFETTIRVLGGLLSAFELSRDRIFLERAKELANRMMPAFGTSTGIPFKMVNLSTGKTGGGSTSVLSELGTLQLEFRYLSRELGDDQYANKVTFGALGDSFYEYLLKVWMQGGRREDSYRRMYDAAIDGVHELLVQKARGLTYLSEWNGTTRQHRMDHLACFMAGNLALGSMTSKDPAKAARDLKTGKASTNKKNALAYTCYQMYLRTATGLSPETVEFDGPGEMRAREKARFYILRPETLESFFVLHQLTGDPVYREWGWDIFRAIERHCRVGVAYGSHPDVENPGREAQDHMESFFPGETLKYLYLLMQPDQRIDLMEYTFNTEAHPLKIFSFDDPLRGQILA
ncbi:unnamed protein product, partial [Scytosiphon promiscuus]